jgi:uncharacterized membrane protein
MDKTNKRFLITFLSITAVMLIIMATVAVLVPKQHIVLILISEIGLAIIWTIISAVYIRSFIHKLKQDDAQ